MDKFTLSLWDMLMVVAVHAVLAIKNPSAVWIYGCLLCSINILCGQQSPEVYFMIFNKVYFPFDFPHYISSLIYVLWFQAVFTTTFDTNHASTVYCWYNVNNNWLGMDPWSTAAHPLNWKHWKYPPESNPRKSY